MYELSSTLLQHGSMLGACQVISILSMWTLVLQPAYAANMWNEALNKRLATEGLDLYGILEEIERRRIAFDQLLTIPEQDDWVYSNGKSTTCVASILEMYKEGGVFGPISNSIQVTEFTLSINTLLFFQFQYVFYLNLYGMYDMSFTYIFVIPTCLRFLRTTKHACQVRATMRVAGFCSVRFLVSIGWNCHIITP